MIKDVSMCTNVLGAIFYNIKYVTQVKFDEVINILEIHPWFLFYLVELHFSM